MKAVIIASVLAILFAACVADESMIRPPKIPILGCTLCQNVVSKVEAAVSANTSVATIQANVQTVCAKYNIQDWCAKNVIPKIPAIVGLIQKKASPSKVCQAIKVCQNRSTEEEMAEEKRDAEKKSGKNPFHGLGINCALCENVVNALEGVITSNETLAKLSSDLTSACTKLGVNNWCQKILLPKLPGIFYRLKTKGDPSQICKAIKLCRNETRPPKPPKPSKPTPTSSDDVTTNVVLAQEFSVGCEVCQAVLTYTKNYVQGNTSQAAITAALNKACNALPFAKDLCQQILIPYVQQIVQGFVAKQDPNQICQRIKLCKPSMEVAEADFEDDVEDVEEIVGHEGEKRAVEGVVKCEICTAVLTYVKNFIGSDTSEAIIKKALDKACSKIPFAKNICTSVIEPYVTQIVQAIIAKQDPAQICAKIKLCTSASNEVVAEVAEVSEVAEVAEKRDTELDLRCGICTAVLSYVKNAIGSDKSQAAIQKAIGDACGKIPFAKNVCSAIIQPFLSQIVQGFIANQDPATICSAKLHLCN